MRLKIVVFALVMGLSKYIVANTTTADSCLLDTTIIVSSADSCFLNSSGEQIISDSLHHKQLSKKEKRKKVIAAIAAFPFPFGFVGAHRVLLGTKPWVPVVYVATFGGCFGVLPLIDFFVIIFEDDIEKFENEPNVFMWTK